MEDWSKKAQELQATAMAGLATVKDAAALEQFRIEYLGSNGKLKAAMDWIKQVPPAEKREMGQQLNSVKKQITDAFEELKTKIAAGRSEAPIGVDVTEPGRRPQIGARHPIMQVIDELTELFSRMGFAVAQGPEVEDEFHNFIALNIPKQHPARDPLDNFYLHPTATDDRMATTGVSEHAQLLRTQTSTVQVRVMQSQKPPIRVVIPGRVYRPDTHDQTHLSMFHQLEALVVDQNVSMVDLKSTVLQFVHGYFGPQTKVRFRPSFFPFTEPSAEVDVWFEDKQRWIELGGCGMVHPNVFKACGIDPEIHSGWAFGFGVERIAMRKFGVEDIRNFVENDVRFLRQFA
jgi:phenylalanyl-tRNA synthetase alpha chain